MLLLLRSARRLRRFSDAMVGVIADKIADVHKLAPVGAYFGYSTVLRGEARLSGRVRALCLIVTHVAAADEADRRADDA